MGSLCGSNVTNSAASTSRMSVSTPDYKQGKEMDSSGSETDTIPDNSKMKSSAIEIEAQQQTEDDDLS